MPDPVWNGGQIRVTKRNDFPGFTSQTRRILTSQWLGLSDHLIARFYAVDVTRDGDSEVRAPLLNDAQLDATLNWQSPFENTGTDSIAPVLTALLQSGVIDLSRFGESGRELTESLQKIAGKTGITKLNSRQVFTGMPPLKFSITAKFRAYADPKREVEAPVNQLMAWALPKELAEDGILMNTVKGNIGVSSVYPSEMPALLAMIYKGKSYSPLVIESISLPLGSPIDSNGNFTTLEVPITLSTLTALDRGDWQKITL